MDGSIEWIMESSWGADWGENGYARVLSQKGDLNLDQYAIGPSVIPYTVYDYYSMQQMVDNTHGEEGVFADEETIELE